MRTTTGLPIARCVPAYISLPDARSRSALRSRIDLEGRRAHAPGCRRGLRRCPPSASANVLAVGQRRRDPFQCLAHRVVHRGVQAGLDRAGPGRRREQHSSEQRLGVHRLERRQAGQHLERERSQAVDVGPAINRFSQQLLGRGICHRRHHRFAFCRGCRRRLPGQGPDAEVDDLVEDVSIPIAMGDDVRRLQIAMNQADGVREIHRRREVGQDSADTVHLEPPR